MKSKYFIEGNLKPIRCGVKKVFLGTCRYSPVLRFLDIKTLKSKYFVEGTIKTLRCIYILVQRSLLYKILYIRTFKGFMKKK